MKNKIAITVILLMITAILNIHSEEIIPVKSEGDLTFYFDTATFRATQNRTLHEFYYNIPVHQLSFTKTNGYYTDTLQLTLLLTDSLNKIIINKQWLEPIKIDSLHKIEGRLIPQQIEIAIFPGRYRVSLSMQELQTAKSGVVLLELRTPSYPDFSLKLSTIQIASAIKSESAENRFIKNGKSVLPNPNRIFGATLPVLYFYYEIYNLQTSADADKNTFEINYRLCDLNGKTIKEFPPKTKQKPGISCVDVGGINIKNIDAADMYLAVSITDNATGETVHSKKRFWNLPPTYFASNIHINESAKKISAMNNGDLELHFNQIKFILPQQFISHYSQLDSVGKKNLLTQFWISNDPHPETYINEFWDAYFKNINYANLKFGTGFTPGWKTDRGRIMLKYGKPEEVHFYPMTSDSKPYEEWYYYQPEQFKFIFVDEEGFGRYRLIYSSDEKEVTVPNWQTIISK